MTSLACIFRVWIGPDVSSKSSQTKEGCPLPIVSRAWHFDSPFQQECKSNSILHVGLAMQRVAGLQCCVVLFLLAIFVYQKTTTRMGQGSRTIGLASASWLYFVSSFLWFDRYRKKNYIIYLMMTDATTHHSVFIILYTIVVVVFFLFVVASCAPLH